MQPADLAPVMLYASPCQSKGILELPPVLIPTGHPHAIALVGNMTDVATRQRFLLAVYLIAEHSYTSVVITTHCCVCVADKFRHNTRRYHDTYAHKVITPSSRVLRHKQAELFGNNVCVDLDRLLTKPAKPFVLQDPWCIANAYPLNVCDAVVASESTCVLSL